MDCSVISCRLTRPSFIAYTMISRWSNAPCPISTTCSVNNSESQVIWEWLRVSPKWTILHKNCRITTSDQRNIPAVHWFSGFQEANDRVSVLSHLSANIQDSEKNTEKNYFWSWKLLYPKGLGLLFVFFFCSFSVLTFQPTCWKNALSGSCLKWDDG